MPTIKRWLTFLACMIILAFIGARGAIAADLLRRVPGSMLFGPTAVWTDGTTTAVFHPVSDSMQSMNVSKIRLAFQLSELSGPCRIRPAIRFSNDGITWDGPQPIDTTGSDYITTNTISYGTTLIDINAISGTTPRPYVQFGVQAANASAGATGFCNATLRVETKGP